MELKIEAKRSVSARCSFVVAFVNRLLIKTKVNQNNCVLATRERKNKFLERINWAISIRGPAGLSYVLRDIHFNFRFLKAIENHTYYLYENGNWTSERHCFYIYMNMLEPGTIYFYANHVHRVWCMRII